jgi:hypothetical protein
VATIPLEIAGEVADAATEFVAAEAIVLDYLRSGSPKVPAFAEARGAMMDALSALSRRLRTG